MPFLGEKLSNFQFNFPFGLTTRFSSAMDSATLPALEIDPEIEPEPEAVPEPESLMEIFESQSQSESDVN